MIRLAGRTSVGLTHDFYTSVLGSTSLGSASSIQAAVRQLEAEADAIIQMVREGQRARRLQQTPPPSSSGTVTTAAAAVAAAAVAAAAAGTSVAASHAPSNPATSNPAASSATVSMSRTDSRITATHLTYYNARTHTCFHQL